MKHISKGGKRPDLNNRYFRSKMEANYARYLNLMIKVHRIKSWEYEPEEFKFPVKRGNRFYRPDFKVKRLDGSTEYHEVKGYLDKASATKLKRMERYYPYIKIILVDKEYFKDVSKVLYLIKGWE